MALGLLPRITWVHCYTIAVPGTSLCPAADLRTSASRAINLTFQRGKDPVASWRLCNGKIERYHRTIKAQCIRPLSPLSLDDAKRGVEQFVTEYNTVRLHSAIGYVTPQAMLEGRQQAIFEERDRKLAEARQRRAGA